MIPLSNGGNGAPIIIALKQEIATCTVSRPSFLPSTVCNGPEMELALGPLNSELVHAGPEGEEGGGNEPPVNNGLLICQAKRTPDLWSDKDGEGKNEHPESALETYSAKKMQ